MVQENNVPQSDRCLTSSHKGKSLLLLIRSAVLFWIVLNFPSPLPARGSDPSGLFVTDIAVDPADTDTLYAATGFSIGVLKSRDGGKSWRQINHTLRSLAPTQIVVDPIRPGVIYLADGCAGLYVSHDGGERWQARNDGLSNSEIGILRPHPMESGTTYAVTTRGVHKGEDEGGQWHPFNQGDSFTRSLEFIDLLVLPTDPIRLYLASKRGLYTRKEGDRGWVLAGEALKGKQISSLAHHSDTGRLFAGVFRRGSSRETLREGGLFASDDGGKSWSRLGEGLEQLWIRKILPHPTQSDVLFLATSGRGVLKSIDGGKNWRESNQGLSDPELDIRVLVMDPGDPRILYAGSHGRWIFRSRDGGESWKPLPIGTQRSTETILSEWNRVDDAIRQATPLDLPNGFHKCNRCHGWTDPILNQHPGSWRVAVNARDWGPTVKRMSREASLTAEEESEIIAFLNQYTKMKRSGSGKR